MHEIKNKEFLKDLVLNVSFRFQKIVGDKYFNTSQKRINHLIGFTRICVLLLENKISNEIVKKIVDKLFLLGLNKCDVQNYLNIMNKLLVDFCEKKKINIDKLYLKEFNQMCLKYFEKSDNLFEIESEKRDENIEKMHYKDEEKISAKEFLNEGAIDESIIEEIRDILEEYYVLNFNEIDKNYIQHLIRIISEFIHVFNYSFEFKDLAYGLETFLILLESTDIEHIENKELVKLLIDSIIDDLNKFFQSVFINQDAIDIHYLDASLLANIAQIEMILNQLKGE